MILNLKLNLKKNSAIFKNEWGNMATTTDIMTEHSQIIGENN